MNPVSLSPVSYKLLPIAGAVSSPSTTHSLPLLTLPPLLLPPSFHPFSPVPGGLISSLTLRQPLFADKESWHSRRSDICDAAIWVTKYKVSAVV